MSIYQHDSAETFRVVLKGDLDKSSAQHLQWAWETVKSILDGKELVIGVSDVRMAHLEDAVIAGC